MGYAYAVLGAGRQGTAAAFDLAVRGDATSVALADADHGAAERAAARVNALAGWEVATGAVLDAGDEDAVAAFLEPVHAAVSAVPYGFNLGVSRAALRAGTSVCDLGGNTAIVRRQLEMDGQARERGVCVVPDCGEAPGLANNLVAYALGLVEDPVSAVLYDGGLPVSPVPPWNYALTFNIDGLTNEYDGATTYVVDRALVEVPCFDPSEYELVDFGERFGTLEAFAANTASTMPWTLGASLRTLKAKVLRYPGHAAQFAAFRDAGLFSKEPVVVGGVEVVPRDVLHAVLEPRIRATPDVRDVVVNRVVVTGARGDRAEVDLIVDVDEATGFSAMERATGFHAAIVCHLMASGAVEPGARPVEVAVDPRVMIDAAKARGFAVTERVERGAG